MSDIMKCRIHSEYKGAKRPMTTCNICKEVYRQVQIAKEYGFYNPPEKPSIFGIPVTR